MLTQERLTQLRKIADQNVGGCDRMDIAAEELLELLDAEERLTKVETFAHTIAPMPGAPRNEGLPLKLKSVPDHPKMQEMAQSLLGSAVQMLRMEIEHSPPDKRNRLTVTVFWNDEKWNLTLGKGDYESVMEAQRDEARADAAYWMQQGPVEQIPNNDHEQDGN